MWMPLIFGVSYFLPYTSFSSEGSSYWRIYCGHLSFLYMWTLSGTAVLGKHSYVTVIIKWCHDICTLNKYSRICDSSSSAGGQAGSEPIMGMAWCPSASSDPACPPWQGTEGQLHQQGQEQEQLEATAGLGGRRHRAPSLGSLLKGAWATTATGSRALTPSPEQWWLFIIEETPF